MKRERNIKREVIIQKGAQLILKNGYHGTGIQQIVDAAGVPKGSFYNYFKSKEDFVLAAMETISQDHVAAFEEALRADTPSPRRRIIDAYAVMARTYEETRNFTTGCLVGNMCQELADTNIAVAEKAEYLFRAYTAVLARCIRSAQAAGEVTEDTDPDRLAEAIFNSWEGAVLRMKSSRNIQPLNAFLDMLDKLLT